MERCKICHNAVRRAGIDAALAQGLSSVQIARDQSNTGWDVNPTTVTRHRGHYIPPVGSVHPGATGRDLLTVVRDLTLDAIDEGNLTILDKNWKNVGPGIAAQKGLDQREFKRDDRKTALALGLLLAGGLEGFTAPPELLGDGMTIEGEAVELDE